METRDPGSTRVGSGGVQAATAVGRAVRMPGARLVTRKVSAKQTGGAYSLFEVEVGPGGGEGPHVQHREDESFYVLEGHFELVVEGSKVEVGPGSLAYVSKGNLHAYRNAGDVTGRMLVSQTPGGAYECFVEKVGQPVADGRIRPEEAPNAKRSAAVGTEYGLEMVPSFP